METIQNMMMLFQSSEKQIRESPESALGMQYFVKMFKEEIQSYVKKLISKRKPKKVVVCMIYFPDEKDQSSWSSTTLSHLQVSNFLSINDFYSKNSNSPF